MAVDRTTSQDVFCIVNSRLMKVYPFKESNPEIIMTTYIF